MDMNAKAELAYIVGRSETVDRSEDRAIDLTLEILALMLEHLEKTDQGIGILSSGFSIIFPRTFQYRGGAPQGNSQQHNAPYRSRNTSEV